MLPTLFSRSSGRRRRWTLAVAYAALLASCDSPFAPDVEEVVRLDVSPPVLLMVVGGNATVTARVYGAGDNLLPTAKVFWSSQDPTVVTVNQEGVATAVGSGTAQIAASAGGLSRTIAVTVSQRPIALVRIAPPAATVAVGATFTLQGEALDGTGTLLTNRLLEWVSSNPAVATVSAAGLVTGVSVGQSTISATGEGKTGTALVTVIPTPIASISVQPNGGNLPAGGTLLLVATPRDAAGQPLTGRTLEWRSSNDAIATVSGSGLLTAIAPGQVTITVSAPGAGAGGSTPSASVNITVLIQPVANAVIVPSPASVQVGQTLTLTVNLFGGGGEPLSSTGRTITWSSGNQAVASVNSSGTVTGVSVGTSTITATITTPGQAQPVLVNVTLTVNNQPVASVTITPSPAVVHVGYTTNLTAVARDAAGNVLPGRTIIWTSSNQSIASVDESSGIVSGATQGSVQIRATSEGVQGTASVTVDLVRINTVLVTPPSATLQPTQTIQLTAAPRDSANNLIQGPALGGRATTWGSSNPLAATVNTGGLVTAVAQGQATIIATIGGTPGQSAVTVSASPSASQLSITTQPSASAQNDVAFAIQPAIQLKDATGANVAQAGVAITAAITAPGTGALGGTVTAITNAAGVATFAGLKITGTTGARTLTFTSGTLPPVTSTAITVLPGAATQLVITTQPPATAGSGQAFSSASVVQLRDISGNNVPQSGVLVTATAQPSAGVTLGGGSATTSASGAATFGALNLTGPTGNYTLTFASGALAPAVSTAIAISAGSGSKLSLSTQPSPTAVNGVPFATQPVVQLLDGSNNPVAQGGVVVTVAIVTGGGSLGGTTTSTTNASGVATFSGLSITGTVGTRTLLFGASGYTTVTSNAIDVTAGSASHLSIVTQPSPTAQSGAAFGSQPSVQLVDGSGNPVSQAGVSVSVSVNGAGASLIGTTTVATDGGGLATFSGLGLSGTVGNYSLSFAASGLTGTTSSSIALAAGAAAQLTISTQPAGASSGSAFTTQPVIQVRDAQGNAVSQSGIVVTPSVASGGAATLLGGAATTDGSGMATFSGLGLSGPVGSYTIGFAAPPLTGVTSTSITLGAGAVAQMIIVQQPAGAASGAAFTTQPAIELRDAQSNPVTVAGITVAAAVNGSGATVIGTPTAQTNGSGLASFSGLGLSGTVGSYTLDFSTSGAPNVTSGTIALAAGAAAQLTMTTQPSATVVTGNTLAQQPAVQVRDGAGNALTVDGVSVSVSISAGGATLTGPTTATSASGVATFAGLGITGSAGTYTLTFSAAGLASTTSSPISVTAGPPTQITITTQPAGASSGSAFTTQPAIQLRDAGNNPAAQSGVTVTASIASGPGGATLVGSASAITDAFGLATFSGLGLSGTVGSYTLTFTSGVLPNVTSAPIVLGPGAPAQLSIQTQPAGAVNGVAFTTQPVILVSDAQNNPVSQAVTVNASVSGATLIGPTSVQSNASGLATFSGLGLSGLVGNYTVDFSATGLPTVTSASIALAAGAAARLSVTTQPSPSVASGSAFAQAPAVQLEDAGGNPVSTTGVQVAVSISAGGASLTGSTTASTAGGLATFTGLGVTGSAGNYTLSFSAAGLTGVSSNPITVTAGAATQLTVTTQPPSTVAVGAILSPSPAVQLRDASGNAVSQAGVDVTAGLSGTPGGSLTGTINVATNASGVATFADLGIDAAGTYTIGFSSPGLTGASTTTITVTLPASQLSVSAQPSATAASGAAFAAQPSVQLRDASNAPVSQSGVQVTASVTGGGATLLGTAMATTNASGVATFSDLGITGTVGNYTLTFSSGSLTSATSGIIALGPGAPTQVTITTQPASNATNGTALSPQPAIQLLDAAGNNATSNGITVTATLNGAGGSVTGNTASTTGGAATFSGLTITGLVGNYTLTFSAAGVAGTATSGTIALGAGAATQVTITTQPGGAQAGQPLNPQPVVLVRDVSGNPVSGVTVTATKESGSGTLNGTAAVLTDASGVATYTNLSISQQGGKQLRFTIPGGVFVLSGSFNITP